MGVTGGLAGRRGAYVELVRVSSIGLEERSSGDKNAGMRRGSGMIIGILRGAVGHGASTVISVCGKI